MPAEGDLQLYVDHRLLAETLREVLQRLTESGVTVLAGLDEVSPAAVLITTTRDCSPAQCAMLAEAGVDVVLLAPLPSGFDEATYRNAGAVAYLAMDVGLDPLLEVLRSIRWAAGIPPEG